MNVSSATFATSYPVSPTTSDGGAAANASESASVVSTLATDTSSDAAASTTSSTSGGQAPGSATAKQLKDLGAALIALMLIKDPVARAKAAADLYKQFSQVAKQYAGAAGGDGSTAADPSSSSDASQAAAPAPDATADASDAQAADPASPVDGADAAATVPTTGTLNADGSTPSPTPAIAATTPASVAADPVTPLTAISAASTAAGTTGGKTGFAADPMMEEIKGFAEAAKQIYQSAVQEAHQKHKDTSSLKGTVDEMNDAQNTLTQAAQAVEGPAATADGYSAVGAALSSSTPASSPAINVTV